MSENRIFDNTGLNINLDSDPAWKQNDPGDPDDGPNGLQNHPVLTSMIEALAGTTLTGTLDSLPNRTYRFAFPATADRASVVVVESLGDTPVPIVVELSTYGNTPAVGTSPFRFWGAGTNMVATRVR